MAPAGLAKATTLKGLVAKAIIGGFFLGVFQNIVGLTDVFKLLLGC